jgi:hypothetical protein
MMSRPKTTPRVEFHETDGFALYTDVNDQLMEDLADKTVPRMEESSRPDDPRGVYITDAARRIINSNPAGASLFFTVRAIQAQVPSYYADREAVQRRLGITAEDKARAERAGAFEHGFADLAFPWHFSAALANAAADILVENEALTQAEKNSFTLHDWSNIIRSDWFSRLAHLMALTVNGKYGSFGNNLSEYRLRALNKLLADKEVIETLDQEVLEYSQELDQDNAVLTASVKLSHVALRGLRALMRNDPNTKGCPVARYSVLLPRTLVNQNPHVQSLIARGTLKIVEERSTDDQVRLIQEETAIDKTLKLFASQLDQYEDSHGTPEVNAESFRTHVIITHRVKPPISTLVQMG